MHNLSTLVPYPTSVHPTPYTYIDGAPWYTAIDRFHAYAHRHGMSHDQARILDGEKDLREIELSALR